MIQKELKQLIDKYCMGIEPTDAQMDEIFDLVGEMGADPQEVAEYMQKMQNGPTREELEAKKKAELEAKKKAELEAKKKAELKAKKKAELEAKKKAELEAKKKAQQQVIDSKNNDEKKDGFIKNIVEIVIIILIYFILKYFGIDILDAL